MIGIVIAVVVIAAAVFVAFRRMPEVSPTFVVITADTSEFDARLRALRDATERMAETVGTRLLPAMTELGRAAARAAVVVQAMPTTAEFQARLDAIRRTGVSTADLTDRMRKMNG